ncbi:MAG: DUF3501 family protein [Acidimicrobiales bacterium]
MSVELSVDDISDLRAYERERAAFRAHVIEMKKKRRIHLGPLLTLLAENRETVRFQIQEMARVEKITTDAGIETELRTYNPLISRPGKLSATMFVELTNSELVREWLPRLVGIEQAIELHLGVGDTAEIILNRVDRSHDDALTRQDTTSTVHYVWWPVTAEQVEKFVAGPTRIVCAHAAYRESTELTEQNRIEIGGDLR